MGSNQSWVTEFILVGFQLSAEMEVLLFWIFSLFYIFSLLANGMILGLICLDPSLHNPMYFFLSHLAIIDMSYASNNVPKMLANLTFLYWCFAITECLILVVMSYDRFVAICHPLHYTVIMNWRVCTVLAVTSWSCGFILALVHAILLLRLPFCGPREVNHLFCEILSVLKLACGDTWINQVVILAVCMFGLVGPLSLMLVSYMRIFWAVLKIQSKEGRRKAFSTCFSHLCVVGLFFGIAMVVYMVPESNQQEEQEKILSLFHSLFNPMLNPLIYTAEEEVHMKER
ncbi:olfactory receptor 2A2-like [Diceros bicornis minor]|uniref:olfactory receptor 2A2-like n=1 Tax=Diceros bicornis minor TaxID=77932 RepID=UPI0026F0CD5C|nr:olfactory receptor 2A2-like [Diceros bicornis minor]